MKTTIRVLIIEDRGPDTELMLRELRQAGLKFDWKWASNREEYLELLEWKPDLILADYNLPQFDAITALTLLQERSEEIPFIIVSGTIGEDTAVEAMKQGAADYVIKDRMARLGQAATRALEQQRLREERKQAQRQLRDNEQRFRALIEESSDMVALIDSSGRLLYASPSIERILGYGTGELIGSDGFDLVHTGDRESLQNGLLELTGTPRGRLSAQYRVKHKDGSWRWLESVATNLLDEPAVQAVVINSRDITERKQTEAELQTYRQHLEELVEQRTAALRAANEELEREITQRQRLEKEVLQISGREQRRIGQDLHDGLGQQLTGLAFLSKILGQKLRDRGAPEASQAREIHQLVGQALNQARDMARGLYPVNLQTNFCAALEHLAATTRQMFNVQCTANCDPAELVKDNLVATELYHIAQEAITNAIKHGKAQTIVVSLTGHPDRIVLEIRDNGVGFGKKSARGQGMGMHIMNYRARMLGASLKVDPGETKGTVVVCTIQTAKVSKKKEMQSCKKA
jgi:two-component system sensor histidine kinase UhpB